MILCHELDVLQISQSNDFEIIKYTNWQELKKHLKELLADCKIVMMEISEDGMLAGCNYVDYGTAKMIEKLNKQLKLSNIISVFADSFRQFENI